jgi:serine/threonine protein phosphatase PrpC
VAACSPLVFATDRLVVAGMLEPCYDNGGDALDYAVNDDVLHVIIRDGRLARTLSAPPATPLGIPLLSLRPVVAEESLEPGDLLLLYTDGLTEAGHPHGQMFTVAGLAEFIEREAAAGQTAPETLRRLRQAIVDRQPGQLKDDTTAMLVEWRRGAETTLLAHTAD